MSELFKYRADAHLSECGKYRYWLSRVWNEALPLTCWIMLNPSTADATEDDPTIRRCMKFAQKWGAGGIYVVNLFALRSTDPKLLAQSLDPIGLDNDRCIMCGCAVWLAVVAAWGVNGVFMGRDRQVTQMLAECGVQLKCLGVTKHGHPRHPLYVPSAQELIDYPQQKQVAA